MPGKHRHGEETPRANRKPAQFSPTYKTGESRGVIPGSSKGGDMEFWPYLGTTLVIVALAAVIHTAKAILK